MLRHLSCLGLALVLATEATGSDWNQFRGPTGQGQAESKNLPTEWGPNTKITWKTEIPGKGWSSPVIAAGKIYLTTAVGDARSGASLRALCLNAADGKIVWNREVCMGEAKATASIHAKNSLASPTPIVAAGKVYVHFGHLGTACLNTADGTTVWLNRTLNYSPVHGNGGSPVLVGDKLIFCVDGSDRQEVVALEAATGKVAWTTPRKAKPRKAFSFCTPLVISVDGREQVICPGADVVQALNPATGAEIWRCTYEGYSVVPRPVFGLGLVFISTGYDTAQLLAIKPDGSGDVTKTHIAWTAKKSIPRNASPVLVGETLYTVSDDGILAAWDAKTGKERWTERVGGKFSASMLAANGLIYLLDEEGKTTVFRPGPTYDLVAVNKLSEKTLASFGVDGDNLYIRTEGRLYKVGK